MRTITFSAVAILIAVTGCHPKEGTPCDISAPLQCKGKKHAMVCLDGIWHLYNCYGPDGCWIDGPRSMIICDMSYAHEGDICAPVVQPTGDSACSLDDEQDVLRCVDDYFIHSYRCPDDTICVLKDNRMLDCE